jgi:hypothetical protein
MQKFVRWTAFHCYPHVYGMLKLLILIPMKLRSGEIPYFVLWNLSTSRWQKDDFNMGDAKDC